jgi:hypothetical protein
VKKNIDFGDIGGAGTLGNSSSPRPSTDDMEALLSGGLLGDEHRMPLAATGSESATPAAGGAASTGRARTATLEAGDEEK